jgi:TonB-linked SusC/RagA family outer membrane protein
MSPARRAFAAVLLGLMLPAAAAGQNVVITGTVRTPTGEPVRGAFVFVESLNLATVTNDAGSYRLLVSATQATGSVRLQVQSIGYRPTEIHVPLTSGATARHDITLTEEAIALEEVVVTGTAGRQERRAQPAVVAKIDAGRVAEIAPVNNIANLLQTRVPGLSLSQGAGSVGTGPRIRIRGASSISLSNEPLVFIDGIRADAAQRQIFGLSGQEVSRLNDIAPEDIETVEVVKGPAAATLYGADASAGVINIITKRGRAEGGFSQTFSADYTSISTSFEPPTNFGTCAASHIRPIAVPPNPPESGGVLLCQGKAVGDIVSDNPLARLDAFRTGRGASLSWTLRGGGQNYGVFLSATGDQENGTLPNNEFRRLTWRSNFDFLPRPTIRLEGGFALSEARARLPYSDNSVYGFVAAGFLGNPLTVGTVADGLYSGAGVGGVEGRSNIENTDRALRIQPRLSVGWTPSNRFTHRLTLGGDLTRTQALAFFPKNSLSWYASERTNSGTIDQGRDHYDRWTADYLGNYALDITPTLRTDFSWGLQTIIQRRDLVTAAGVGLVANPARSVGAASERTSDQDITEDRSNGVFGQIQASHRDRLYFQLAGRLDRNSAFGAESQYFFSPRVGVSYVISDESFWRPLAAAVSTFRLRAAYGTTGRSPTSGTRATYEPASNVLPSEVLEPGVVPEDPGNTGLKPERGTEIEAGFEAGLFNERVSLEATYFHKTTSDVILRRPIAPSLGFNQNPYVNIGKVLNRGVELAATARLVTLPSLGWEARLTFATLHNEVLDMGGVEPFGTTYRTREGAPVGSFHSFRIRHVDVAKDTAFVSNDLEFVGNVLPGWEGTAGTTVNFLRGFTLYGQFDFRGDVLRFEGSAQFRDRQFRNSERWVRRNDTSFMSAEERLRRFGPFRNEKGETVTFGNVNEEYIEDASFVRLRELSLAYRIPTEFAARYLRVREAGISVAGRNLVTWTPYSGLDPETIYQNNTEFFTVPADRRWLVRLTVRP